MKNTPNKHIKYGLSFICGLVINSLVFAVEPMNEMDLGGVSADIGYNPIEMYAAPSAGLVSEGYDISKSKFNNKADSSSNKPSEYENLSSFSSEASIDQYAEGDSTKDFVENELRNIEVNDIDKSSIITAFNIDEEAFEEAIHAGEYVVTNTKFLTSLTTSEVRYKESNVHHKSTIQLDGSIKGQTDVTIDLFKFEHLMGDSSEGRDAGNLFLSDFSIQTNTHTTSHQ